MSTNIIKQDYHISQKERNYQKQHNSFLVWFTGLSGSGKSTLANELEKSLFKKGIHTYTLDGDNIRSGLNQGLGFSEEDRRENIRRIAEVGRLFVDAGIVTIAAFISPLQQDRQLAKNIVGAEDFIEVFVNAPLEVCEKRDVKGLYQKARTGTITDFTGIDAPYEIPGCPDIEIKTEEETVEESVQRLIQMLNKKLEILNE